MVEEQGLEIAKVAEIRKLGIGTITGHLCSALENGLYVTTSRLGVTPKVQALIENAIRSPPINSNLDAHLKTIKAELPEEIKYDEIKVVVAIMRRISNCTEIIKRQNDPGTGVGSTSDDSVSVGGSSQSPNDSSNKRKLPTWAVSSRSQNAGGKKPKVNSIFN